MVPISTYTTSQFPQHMGKYHRPIPAFRKGETLRWAPRMRNVAQPPHRVPNHSLPDHSLFDQSLLGRYLPLALSRDLLLSQSLRPYLLWIRRLPFRHQFLQFHPTLPLRLVLPFRPLLAPFRPPFTVLHPFYPVVSPFRQLLATCHPLFNPFRQLATCHRPFNPFRHFLAMLDPFRQRQPSSLPFPYLPRRGRVLAHWITPQRGPEALPKLNPLQLVGLVVSQRSRLHFQLVKSAKQGPQQIQPRPTRLLLQAVVAHATNYHQPHCQKIHPGLTHQPLAPPKNRHQPRP